MWSKKKGQQKVPRGVYAIWQLRLAIMTKMVAKDAPLITASSAVYDPFACCKLVEGRERQEEREGERERGERGHS